MDFSGVFTGVGFATNGIVGLFNGWRQRVHQEGENEKQRDFQEGENEKQRDFQEGENEKQRALQREINQYLIESQKQIASSNQQVQINLAKKQRNLQKELAQYSAHSNRSIALESIDYRKISDNFPIASTPDEVWNITNTFPAPLSIVLVPPKIEKPHNTNELAGQEELLYKEIKSFLSSNYDKRNVLLFSGKDWNKADFTAGDEALIRLFHYFKSIPFLIVETIFVRDTISLRATYWNTGADTFGNTNPIIKDLPLSTLVTEFKKNYPEMVDYDIYTRVIKSLSAIIAISISMFTDAHLILNGVIDRPLLPRDLSTLLAVLPNGGNIQIREFLLQWVLSEYHSVLNWNQVPDKKLESGVMSDLDIQTLTTLFSPNPLLALNCHVAFASALYKTEYKIQAQGQLVLALDIWRHLHNVLDDDWELLNLEVFSRKYDRKVDEEFFDEILPVVINASSDTVPREIFKLLSLWSEAKFQKII